MNDKEVLIQFRESIRFFEMKYRSEHPEEIRSLLVGFSNLLSKYEGTLKWSVDSILNYDEENELYEVAWSKTWELLKNLKNCKDLSNGYNDRDNKRKRSKPLTNLNLVMN